MDIILNDFSDPLKKFSFKDVFSNVNASIFHTFRWKIFLSYIFVGILPLIIFFTIITSTIERYFIEQRTIELKRQANIFATHINLSNYLTDESRSAVFASEMEQYSKESFRTIVVDSNAVVVEDTNKQEIGKTLVVPEILEALEKNQVVRVRDKSIVHAAVSVVNSNSKLIGVVLISASIEDIFALLLGIKNTLYLYTLITGLIMFLLSFFVSKIVVDPLKGLVKVIQKMADGKLDERIKIKGNNEISEVATAFNVMTEKLEKVHSARQEFVSNVSHELKTPLSSIKVLSESILLQQDVPEEMYKEFLQDITNEVDRMTNIINDLLNLVKIDQKEIPLIFEVANLNKLVEDILKRLYPLASQKNIELVFESVKEVNASVDEMKLSLAITNLVENGIKYTPENGVVSITVDSDHQNAFLKVSDSGIGIAEEELNKIFERFYRVDKTRDRETGGTGLGLAITHSTIMLHGGAIKAMSKEDEGSTFVVRIPLSQPQ